MNPIDQTYHKQLLEVCRFYQGEAQCPFPPDAGNNRSMLWWGEFSFVHAMENPKQTSLEEACRFYLYHVGDKLPATGYEVQRNAELFNMYCKGCYSAASAVEDFIQMIHTYYPSEDV